MRLLLIFLCLLYAIGVQAQSSRYHITITPDQPESYKNKIYLVTTLQGVIDSGEIVNGRCIFHHTLQEPQLAVLVPGQMDKNYPEFILTADSLFVSGNLQNPRQTRFTFTNKREQQIYEELRQQFREHTTALRRINQAIRSAKDSLLTKKYESECTLLLQQERNYLFDFVQKNSTHYGMAIAIHEIILPCTYLKTAEFQKVYDLYSPELQNSSYGKALLEYIHRQKQGSPYINTPMYAFELPDSSGQFKTLKDFKSRYLLIDLWASWCAPCREFNTELKKYYAQYHHQGFEILGISVDRSPQAWLKALREDRTPWIQLSDQEGLLVRHYRIGKFPSNFLLDKSGKIIAVDLFGSNLQQTLEKQFSIPEK